MKNKLAFVSLVIFLLCSCTAENDKKPLICEALLIDGSTDGFELSALYTVSGSDTVKSEEKTAKKYYAKTAAEVLDKLIKEEKDAMFKPVKKLVLRKDSPYNADIVKAYVNRSELQLKCNVFENEAPDIEAENENADGEAIPFPEYYRKLTEDENEAR